MSNADGDRDGAHSVGAVRRSKNRTKNVNTDVGNFRISEGKNPGEIYIHLMICYKSLEITWVLIGLKVNIQSLNVKW